MLILVQGKEWNKGLNKHSIYLYLLMLNVCLSACPTSNSSQSSDQISPKFFGDVEGNSTYSYHQKFFQKLHLR